MRRPIAIALFVLLLTSTATAQRPPTVVVSIAPVHSLVAGVMAGVGEPRLLLPPGASPHSYSLRPSEAQALAQATLVVWVGAELETFLEKPLRSLASQARLLTLMDAPGMHLLEVRDEAEWGGHEHEHGGAHGQHDPHLWLDPRNGIRIVQLVSQRLQTLDPPNAQRYRANAAALEVSLTALDRELADELAPVRGVPFAVFHDAYHYFEHRYQLNAVGAITVNPERPPGAKGLARIQRRISATGVRCVFREPQFESSLVQAVVRGTQARVAVLDPLGAGLEPGPQAYPRLLREIGRSLGECLKG